MNSTAAAGVVLADWSRGLRVEVGAPGVIGESGPNLTGHLRLDRRTDSLLPSDRGLDVPALLGVDPRGRHDGVDMHAGPLGDHRLGRDGPATTGIVLVEFEQDPCPADLLGRERPGPGPVSPAALDPRHSTPRPARRRDRHRAPCLRTPQNHDIILGAGAHLTWPRWCVVTGRSRTRSIGSAT